MTLDKLRRPFSQSRLLKATWEAFDHVLDSRSMNLYLQLEAKPAALVTVSS
jgi:hypothetical protein